MTEFHIGYTTAIPFAASELLGHITHVCFLGIAKVFSDNAQSRRFTIAYQKGR